MSLSNSFGVFAIEMAVVVNWFEWIIPQLCIPFIHMGLGWGNHNILLDIWKQTNEYRSCI